MHKIPRLAKIDNWQCFKMHFLISRVNFFFLEIEWMTLAGTGFPDFCYLVCLRNAAFYTRFTNKQINYFIGFFFATAFVASSRPREITYFLFFSHFNFYSAAVPKAEIFPSHYTGKKKVKIGCCTQILCRFIIVSYALSFLICNVYAPRHFPQLKLLLRLV